MCLITLVLCPSGVNLHVCVCVCDKKAQDIVAFRQKLPTKEQPWSYISWISNGIQESKADFDKFMWWI